MTATTGELHAYLAADTTPTPRRHVYGRTCWCGPTLDDASQLVHRDAGQVAEEARHADTARERDEARAALARVRALAALWSAEGDESGSADTRELLGAAATDLRVALGGAP